MSGLGWREGGQQKSSVCLTYLTLECPGTSLLRRRGRRGRDGGGEKMTTMATQWPECLIRFLPCENSWQVYCVQKYLQWLKIMKMYSSNRGFELYKDIKVLLFSNLYQTPISTKHVTCFFQNII